jgi:outer membrane autotransporter protein
VAAQYRSDVTASGFGGRVEGGWRTTVAPGLGVIPYAGLQTQAVWTPAYNENVVAGPAAFALNYASSTIMRTRSELGAGFESVTMGPTPLIVYARAAWAHDFTRDRSITAGFQTLPGTLFSVTGASPAANSALVRAGAELRLANGIKLGSRFEAEVGGGSAAYSGLGVVSMTW